MNACVGFNTGFYLYSVGRLKKGVNRKKVVQQRMRMPPEEKPGYIPWGMSGLQMMIILCTLTCGFVCYVSVFIKFHLMFDGFLLLLILSYDL